MKNLFFHFIGSVLIILGLFLSNKKIKMLKVAILDDYQNVSQEFVDLKKLSGKYEFKIFSEPFLDEADAIEQLADFEALLIMRERTPITKNLIDNLMILNISLLVVQEIKQLI
jgi:phosphoglycerate dehydrogenase-like enzyme